MHDPEPLTDVEQLVLLGIARLKQDAYGVSIREEILRQAGRDLSVAATYSALERLEVRGLVIHRLSEPTPERGGRRKKIFRVTGRGEEALLAARASMGRMWEGVELSSRRSA